MPDLDFADLAPCHLVLETDAPLFDSPAAVGAAVDGLRAAVARVGGLVLAFAVVPAAVDLLVVAARPAPDLLRLIRDGVTRRVNQALRRSGRLFERGEAHRLEDGDDWLAVAEAIESRLDEAAGTPASSAHPEHAEWVRVPTAAPAARRPSPAPPTGAALGDLLAVPDLPTVVQLAAIEPILGRLTAAERLSSESRQTLESYLVGWYLTHRSTLAVARAVLGGLGHGERGAAWFISGLYGAGKSHLLTVAALAAAGDPARRMLLASHPELADLGPALTAAGDRLAVPVPLDEETPTVSLEEAVFGAAERALWRLGIDHPLAETGHVLALVREHLLPRHTAALAEHLGRSFELAAETEPAKTAAAVQAFVRERGLPYQFHQTRVERLGRLLELSRGAGKAGVLFAIDELAVFLSSRPHRGLQADASFLQFLGQRAEISPVFVLAALQKQIEDVGEIEHYTLRQIKDRFDTRHSLSVTVARQVLARKLIVRREPARFDAAVDATVQAWTGGRRLPGWGRAALNEIYPLHPLTFECLASCAERVLAKSRSLVEFAARAVGRPEVLSRRVPALITPDELWDHFAKDVVQHPDLRRYQEVVGAWYERHLPRLVEAEELPLASRLVKLLLVLRLAGLDREVETLAAALLPAEDGRAERIGALLERLRSGGSYLAVERRPGVAHDLYRLDLEEDLGETIRRKARSLEATLRVGDARLTAGAVEVARDDAFPLATTLHPRSERVAWRNSERPISLALRDLASLSPPELANQAALLADRESLERVYLYLAEPQRVERQAAAFTTALSELSDPRWRQALVAWLPREVTAEERRQWVEDVAYGLLGRDPTLVGGPAGQSARERLDEEAAVREPRLRDLLRRIYLEGTRLAADGRAELAAETWPAALEQLAGLALERIFPRFGEVAPRRQMLPRGIADDLIAGFVIPTAVTVSPQSVRAHQIEEVAAPLGLVDGADGEYRLTAAADGLPGGVLAILPDRPMALTAVELGLARSNWGLLPEQAHLVIAALCRLGHLESLDADERPAPLGAPLRAHVAAVRPAGLLPPALWERWVELAAALFDDPPVPLSAAAQQRATERLQRWRRAIETATVRLRARIESFAEQCDHEPLQWREALGLLARLESYAAGLPAVGFAADLLGGWVETVGDTPAEELRALRDGYRTLRRFDETLADRLLADRRDLIEIELPPGDLAAARDELVSALSAGESVALEAAELLARIAEWRKDYAEAYAAWHGEVHAAARFAPYDAFRGGPWMRALSNLSRLELDVPDSAAAIAEDLRRERLRQCRRADLTLALREAQVCPECRFRLGEPLPLRPVAAFEAAARQGLEGLLAELRKPSREGRIRASFAALDPADPRQAQLERLLAPGELSADELLACSSFALLDRINLALTERPADRRDPADLTRRLAGRRLTRAQAAAAFERWLDPDGRLGPEDLIEFEGEAT